MKLGCQIGAWSTKNVEEAIPGMGEAELQGIEVFEKHIVPYYDEVLAFKEYLDKAGIRLSGVYFHHEEVIDRDKEDEVIEKARSATNFIHAVGGDFLVMNGGAGRPKGTTLPDTAYKQFARIANRIGEESMKRDVRVVMHPHLNYMIETCDDVDRLVEAGIDQDVVGLCVHASHQLLADADPYIMYEKYTAWVRYLHVGNTGDDMKGMLLGEGQLDQDRLHKPLFDAGYDGWMIIECGKEGMSAQEYVADVQNFVKTQWSEFEW